MAMYSNTNPDFCAQAKEVLNNARLRFSNEQTAELSAAPQGPAPSVPTNG